MQPSSPVPIVEHKHWVEQLSQQVISRGPGPYVVSAGMTTSGPTHMGTLCELLYPQAVFNYLKREGHDVQYLFSADILDAFDAVPASHKEFEALLAPHLGKPLCEVPDPQGCCKSLGHHFLNDSMEVGKAFGIAPQIILGRDLYNTKEMEEIAKFFISKADECKQVVSTSSLNPNLPADWSPIMPICQNCGRVSTTRVTRLEPDGYEYICSKDVKYTKGCGQSGKNKLSDHHYKLTWRVHWPAWMKYNHTSIEGAGMDHHTRGGSWDTCQAVFRDLFKTEPPVGYQFGFILFQGKKYSKSKGIGMSVRELLRLMPAEVLAFVLLRPDLTENRDINPTSEHLLRLMGEFQEAGMLAEQLGLLNANAPVNSTTSGNANAPTTPISSSAHAHPASSTHAVSQAPVHAASSAQEGQSPQILVQQSVSPSAELSRADRKRALAFALSNSKPVWRVDFSDLLIYYGLYGNWDAVAQKLGHPADIERLSPYVQAWQAAGLVPDDYQFKFQPIPTDDPAILDWATRLQPSMPAVQIHQLVFTVATERGVKPGELFARLYTTLIGKPRGPKLGRLVEILGVARVKDALLHPANQ